jgi:NTP pyrophosphatase (non-canonical NTP hydrolase)
MTDIWAPDPTPAEQEDHMITEFSRYLDNLGAAFAGEVDRLWPDENDQGYRAQCLAEEAAEVSRAITKRRHAMNSPNGLCKGRTVEEWTGEIELELGQLIGVALDIAHRESISLLPAVRECLDILFERKPDT